VNKTSISGNDLLKNVKTRKQPGKGSHCNQFIFLFIT